MTQALAWTIAGALLGVPLLMYLLQDSLLFLRQPMVGPPVSARAVRAVEALTVVASDGTRLRGWLAPGRPVPAPVLVYFGGNAEEVSWQLTDDRWPRRWSLALVNYRGYGESEGRPSETHLRADAVRLLDLLSARPDVDPARVVVVGRSLGSGVAVAAAAARPVVGVVLLSPFDSMVEVARRHYPWLPVGWLLRHRFEAGREAPHIGAPLLAVVGGRDTVIPPDLSRRLLRAWGGPSRWVEVGGAGHEDLTEGPEFWRALADFLGRVELPPSARNGPGATARRPEPDRAR